MVEAVDPHAVLDVVACLSAGDDADFVAAAGERGGYRGGVRTDPAEVVGGRILGRDESDAHGATEANPFSQRSTLWHLIMRNNRRSPSSSAPSATETRATLWARSCVRARMPAPRPRSSSPGRHPSPRPHTPAPASSTSFRSTFPTRAIAASVRLVRR